MIIAKCIHKFRGKNNKITGYRLEDEFGHIKDITSEELKEAIQSSRRTKNNA